jgi:hypothetical protein
MPDRITFRAVLAVLLLLLTIAGIRAAGPAVGANLAALPVIIGTGCVLEGVLAALLIALRWRRRPPAGPGVRLRLLLSGVIVSGLIAVPLAMLIAGIAKIRPRRRLPQHPMRSGGRPTRLHLGRHGHGAAPGFADFRYVLIAVLVAAIIVAVVLIWGRRRRWARAERLGVPAGEETDTPAQLARAVDSGRIALRELDDSRTAIIRCYLAMEDSLADAGTARGAAETPDELLHRAVADGLVHGRPAGRLTALFYEARFSTHPMPLSRRDEAERALADLAAALSARGEPADLAELAGQAETNEGRP